MVICCTTDKSPWSHCGDLLILMQDLTSLQRSCPLEPRRQRAFQRSTFSSVHASVYLGRAVLAATESPALPSHLCSSRLSVATDCHGAWGRCKRGGRPDNRPSSHDSYVLLTDAAPPLDMPRRPRVAFISMCEDYSALRSYASWILPSH